MFDSVIRFYVFLTRLTERLSSDSEAFDDEDAAPKSLAMTASVFLFNIMLLVHMVGISPRDSIQHMDQGGSLHQIAACCKLMNYGIRHKYANLGISLVMPLYCKLQ